MKTEYLLLEGPYDKEQQKKFLIAEEKSIPDAHTEIH